jgi:hypothetical protein
MHTVDVVVVCLAILAVICCAVVLARQRFMLRAPGAVPVAMRTRGGRWQYGVARYVGVELHWFRSLGLGTRPNQVLTRDQVIVLGHRDPDAAERSALPAAAVIVACRVNERQLTLALGESAYTGFVSWLEASAPMA